MSLATLTILTFQKNKFWAFKQMGLMKAPLKKVKGAKFIKLLGCGSGSGFSLWPDFSTYALLVDWESRDLANEFFEKDLLFQKFRERTIKQKTFWLCPYKRKGHWEGVFPFQIGENTHQNKEILVLTRGRINFWRLFLFWRKVPRINSSLLTSKGLKFQLGVGEWPLIQLATVSIWENEKDMLGFAYQKNEHKKIIKLTQEKHIFVQDMFVRFDIVSN